MTTLSEAMLTHYRKLLEMMKRSAKQSRITRDWPAVEKLEAEIAKTEELLKRYEVLEADPARFAR